MSHVYVICDGKFFKIGFAENLQRRFSHLQSSNSGKLKIIRDFVVDWGCGFEAELHFIFRKNRLHHEWFNLSSKDFWILDNYAKSRINANGELILKDEAKQQMIAYPNRTDYFSDDDWLGMYGESGRKIVGDPLPKRNIFIGGIEFLRWWEIERGQPFNLIRCLEYIGL